VGSIPWHIRDNVMTFRGSVGPHGQIRVRGFYAALPGPDWGRRIVITGRDALRIVMYNITSEAHEELAVAAG
jgi:hypothetical protein